MFKLDSSEWFGEDIRDHIVGTDIHDVNEVGFHVFAYKVISDVNVLESSIVCGVDGQKDSSLII